jgi:excisionase family DNA binding protein
MINSRQILPQKRLLSPRQLATAIGVSESSLKRWIDDGLLSAARTAGKHRRIPLAEAIRFIRSQRAPLVRPDALGLPDLDAMVNELTSSDELGGRLFDLLDDGRSREARGLILSMYIGGMTVAEIADGPLRQAITRIGELWNHAQAGIFIEHRATDICLQAVNRVRMLIEPPADGPAAVGGAPSGDPYLLPSMLAACVLEEHGYIASNLGPNTPAETLVHAAHHSNARLCWLSVSTPRDPLELSSFIDTLANRLRDVGATLVVGGHALDLATPPDSGNVRIGDSMVALAAAAVELNKPLKKRELSCE